MEKIIQSIKDLYKDYTGGAECEVVKLPQSGSIRYYFRIYDGDKTVIATYGDNIKENNTFIYFSNEFRKKGHPVPEVYISNEEGTIYLQEDFGDTSLLKELESKGFVPEVYNLFQKSLKALAALQINGDAGLDYSKCITSHEFGKQAILSDLLYFKYYFLDPLQLPYDKEKLLDDFEDLSTYLTRVDYKYFMFRDFQSRNIMVKDKAVHFIDYQGGMKGALQYDVASMLWQARAELPEEWKASLLDYYIDCVDELLNNELDTQRFVSQYYGYVLIRLLQVLGAYGFRGLFERKAAFLSSIPLALKNLKWFLEHKTFGIVLPEFHDILKRVVSDDIIHRFETVKATEETPLVVEVNSFSYKRALPKDVSGNGGGFIFDCRGILNPGRFEEYKQLTGKDKKVIDFLEQRTKMNEFVNNVMNIIDISVEEYIKRGFGNLQINFGCTGGQHRSVYAAEAICRHLKTKFNVKTRIRHIEQEIKQQLQEEKI